MRLSKVFAVLLALLVAALPAVASSQESNGGSTKPSGDKKSPEIAFVASLVITGGGQGYNGQWGKAALMFGGAAVGWGLIISGVSKVPTIDPNTFQQSGGGGGEVAAGAAILIAFGVWSIIDAPVTASRVNRKNGYSSIPEASNPPLAFQPYFDSKHSPGLKMVLSKNF